MRIGACLVLVVVALFGCRAEQVRPLYIAGFMANSISDVDSYIAAGANVIEADLLFDKHSGHATEFYKGIPCDCFRLCHKRESIINYLQHFKEITTPGHPKFKPSFTGILLIDTNLDDTFEYRLAGRDIASLFARYLFSNTNNAKVILDIANPAQLVFLDAVIEELKDREREDILPKLGIVTTSGDHYNAFIKKAAETGLGLWMGDGISNCLEDFFKLDDVKEACRLRDDGRGVSKVIRWTTDMQRNIKNSMWLGVDVIGTNDVHDVLAVMEWEEFKGRYRLATADDDPFARVKGIGPLRYGCHKASAFHSYWCWRDYDAAGNWCYLNQDCSKNKSGCGNAARTMQCS